MTAAVGDAARDDRDGDHDQGSRRDRETGLEKRVAPPLGKKEDEVEEHAGEGDREYERRQIRETVCAIRKEAEIDPAAQDRRLQEAGGADQRADEASGLMSDWHAIASIDISRKLRPFQIPHEPGRDPAFMWSP